MCVMQWVYQISIENLGNKKYEVLGRSWSVKDNHGKIQEAKESCPVALAPVLTSAHPTFQYISQLSLSVPYVLMR
jgi:uncharacterized protein affecting Mg2+/Co2+ transport